MKNITYKEVLDRFYPGIQVQADTENYDEIIWGEVAPIAAEVLNPLKKIVHAQEERVAHVSNDCELSIISGFESAALGTIRIYDSEQVDQLNLIGAAASTAPTPENPAGTAIYYASRDPATGIKTYDLHTFSQIRKVLEDGAAVKLQKLQKFAQLRNQIYSALTLADIHSIDW